MRFILVSFFCLSATSSFAIPERSDVLIKELISNNAEFASILQEIIDSSQGYAGAFSQMKIERSLSATMRESCGQNSRSAAGLRVSFMTEPEQSYYFVTPGAAANLRRCE